MMAAPFAAGMGPGGHPGLPHGHPMQHPGVGHMGGANPAMMQGMHPGVSGPQVTQGPMMAGMPQGPVTSGPGGPMQAHAMAHLGPGQPNPMFQQQNPQMPYAQMGPQQREHMLRQRHALQQLQQVQQQQGMAGMMQQHGGQNLTPQQFARMGMPMQQQMHMQAQQTAQAHNLQQQQQQQRLMAHQHAQQQQQLLQAQQQQQQQQRSVSQQMQLSRSQEQAAQPPPSQPTPAPQLPAQMQQQPPTPTPAPGAQQKQQQPQQPTSQPQQQQQNAAIEQQSGNPQPQIKQQDMGPNVNTLDDVPMNEGMSTGLNGQGILRLLMFQEQLCPPPDKVHDLDYWETFVQSHFSPFGVLRQQLFNPKSGNDKSYQVQYASIARFYHAHFASGVREMRMEPVGCTETKLPHGGCNVYSPRTYVTYIYDNDIRVITEGSIQCNFDMANRIEHLSINTKAWTEYLPRILCASPESPDQKQSPKMSKNSKRPQQKTSATPSALPSPSIGDMGVPAHIVQFLEIAEVMMVMGPLMEYAQKNPDLRPQDAMQRMVMETERSMINFQNRMAAQQNGQMSLNPGQRTPGLTGPNQFASPGMNHLGLPQQGSPHVGGPAHTPSPAHINQGGIAMVHQMSQGNSNLSGSQGPSTNTSPNVTNKRRRASQVKLEEENASQELNGANKVKPSPRLGGKRQKGTT